MHLVGLRFEPLEVALHAVPEVGVLDLLRVAAGALGIALDDELLHPRLEVAERLVRGHALVGAAAQQIALALGGDAALPRLDHAAFDAQAPVGQRALVVDLDGAAEAAARRAGALRIVEGEERGRGLAERGAVVRADPGAGKPQDVVRQNIFRTAARARGGYPDLAGTVAQGGLDGLGEPRAGFARDGDAVLHHAQLGRRGGAFRRGLVGAADLAIHPHAQEALLLQRGQRGGQRRLARQRHGKADEDFAAVARGEHLVGDLRGAERPHRPAAMRAGQRGQPREEQLEVVGALGHRAHGAAGRLHRVALLDGDGRRKTVDAVDVRLVHALEELARVGREGLDVAALALRVESVEGQRRLARAAQPRDHGEPVMRNIDINVLEIVLARAAHANVAGTHDRAGDSNPPAAENNRTCEKSAVNRPRVA